MIKTDIRDRAISYSGIDYSLGLANRDIETDIRYGVINANECASHLWDELMSSGTDLDYADAMDSIKQDLSHAIKSVLEDYTATFDPDALADDILADVDFVLESTGDCTRYLYESEAETFHTTSDGSIFVTKSEFYTLCAFCSPCAPGAGDLTSEGNVKTYCLGPDWFDSDHPMPYLCFPVHPAGT